MLLEKQKRKKLRIAKGEGGVPGEKWDDPSKKKGPFVPPPKKLAMKDGWEEKKKKKRTTGYA